MSAIYILWLRQIKRYLRSRPRIIASLHTFKQPAHLAIAKELPWDMLVIDEAHYLRNRSSQAWEAVNILPRQFLLLRRTLVGGR